MPCRMHSPVHRGLRFLSSLYSPTALSRAVRVVVFAAVATVQVHAASAQGVVLPSLGDGQDLTTAQERKLGDKIIKELYRDPDYLDDVVMTDYMSTILASLMKAAEARGELSEEQKERYAWQILLGRDKQVNAFALPGIFRRVPRPDRRDRHAR